MNGLEFDSTILPPVQHKHKERIMQIKPVKGFEDHYLVSSCGKLFSKKTSREISLRDNKRGYKVYTTRLKGATIRIRLHRAVAECFIDNPDNKPIVNHKDGDKMNCHVSNLEWNTVSENTSHAWRMGLRK